ncbi:protein-tyrosine phosphatase-like protein [Daldinia eschscholtzii]|nr:protein-tyrosine phosphatase-like protein [Daldinia eschscholtzii]
MADPAALLKLAETDVSQEITKEQYIPVLTNPPFVFLDGTFNTRDVGLVPGSPVRSNFFFRSGALARLTDNGKAVLEGKLGVKRIFDLRSPEERASAPDPVLEGIENTWIESTRPDSTPEPGRFVAGEGEEGYREMYLEVIDVYQESWKAILEHIRDRPRDPFLVHCTAGRDRTGVLSGLLLALAGASQETIIFDYLLSRIGTEPVRSMLLEFAVAGSHAKSKEQPGFHNLVNLRASSWNAFVDGVQKEYGGFEKFVTDKLGFSKDDLAKIKANLTSS